MSDSAPRGPEHDQWPPSTPPVPPLLGEPVRTEATSAGESAPDPGDAVTLTAVEWSVPVAAWVCVAMIGAMICAAAVAGVLAVSGLTGPAMTLAIGASLSAAYVVAIGVVWRVARGRGVGFADAVGMRPVSAGTLVGGTLLAVVVGRVAAGLWGLVVEALDLPVSVTDVDPTRLFPTDAAGVATAFLVAVVLAPLAEEVVFRGVLLSALYRRWGPSAAIVGSSAVFSAIHISPVAVVPIFVLALVLGWLFIKTRSLTVCIVAHTVFNAVGLAALYALKAMGLA